MSKKKDGNISGVETTKQFLVKYRFNVLVKDESGSPIDDATVKLIDANGNTQIDDTTNSTGQLDGGTVQVLMANLTFPEPCSSTNPECDGGGDGDTCLDLDHTTDASDTWNGWFQLNITKDNYTQVLMNITIDEPKYLDVSMHYQGDWNYSQPLGWKVLNGTDTTILKLSDDGNLAIAGTLYENTNTAPPGDEVAFQMKDLFYLTHSGDLYIVGKIFQLYQLFL